MLCEKCQVLSFNDQLHDLHEKTLENGQIVLDFEFSIELEHDRWDTFPDFPELHATAQEGCGFCKLLRDTLLDISPDILSIPLEDRATALKIRLHNLEYSWDSNFDRNPSAGYEKWEGISSLRLKVSSAQPIYEYISFDVVAAEGQFVSDYLRIHRRPLSISTLSTSNVAAMKSWTENCLRLHRHCTRDKFIPTRLIDLGGDNEPTRLITTSEDDRFRKGQETPHYLALSYCWGPATPTHRPLKTERRSLRSRLRGIRFGVVPKTIAEAFTVARVLGYQYIWVDSLCIIQDDKSDWQRESAFMARVYGSAAITLVTASSSSSYDGFLERKTAEVLAVPYTPSRHPDRAGYFYLQLIDPVYHGHDGYHRDIEDTEWNQRSWTFQENLLSHCVLYFGSTMFHYRCQKEIRAENTQAITVPEPSHGCWSYALSKGGVKVWYGVVTDYSDRKLTYPLDKLPALSALAHDMKAKMNSVYLAGLWKDDLVWGLLWGCGYFEPRFFVPDPVRSETYRAPSWSWAAGDGRVSWYKHNNNPDDVWTHF